MKDYLKKLIANLEEKRSNLNKAMIKESEEEKRASIGATLQALANEIEEAKAQLESLDEKPAIEEEERSFKPIKTYETKSEENPLATMEYRKAFMNYAQKGVKSDVLQFRDNATGTADDLGVLLPETIVQSIMQGLKGVYGSLYSKVKKTNIKGGVKYPVGGFTATFNRITETTTSERQRAGGVTNYVQFSYNIGEIRIAQTLLQTVLAVDVFETELAKAIVEAYLKAMDLEILNGVAANNECEGILTEAAKVDSRIPAANIIEFTANEIADWTAWQKKVFAVIPLELEGSLAEFVMAKQTYAGNLCTLADANGQPIKKAGYDVADGMHKFNEIAVNRVETTVFDSFDNCEDDEYFGMLWAPEKAYAINTNLEFFVKRYFDEETNQYIDKALVINDGKVLDPKYIYLFKKSVVA